MLTFSKNFLQPVGWKYGSFSEELTFYRKIMTFEDLLSKNLLKRLWEKENILVTNSVFYPSETEIIVLATLNLSYANTLNFD